MYDRDADLLAHAAANVPPLTADGSRVTVETRQRDITRLDQRDLAGASLITASALLDMLTAAEVERIARSCVEAGCPALLTISVTGRVALTPSDPLDEVIASAFNAHQRRGDGDGRLLGPDAVGVAADMFAKLGAEVVIRPSRWRLSGSETALMTEWFKGWVSAACEQRPELSAATRASNVAFLELDWTPARHDQAEDRLHRIGQESAVTAWYLLAPGTIDETMAELLQRKRSLINAVTDGQVRDEERLVEAVVRELRGRPYRHLRVVA